MAAQIRLLWAVLDHFQLEDVVLVGHSMGGDLATLMASSQPGRRIRRLVNVEGNLTPQDLFISSQAVAAGMRGDFDAWFREEFRNRNVLDEWGAKRESFVASAGRGEMEPDQLLRFYRESINREPINGESINRPAINAA